jgi:hypothetical protein
VLKLLQPRVLSEDLCLAWQHQAAQRTQPGAPLGADALDHAEATPLAGCIRNGERFARR